MIDRFFKINSFWCDFLSLEIDFKPGHKINEANFAIYGPYQIEDTLVNDLHFYTICELIKSLNALLPKCVYKKLQMGFNEI